MSRGKGGNQGGPWGKSPGNGSNPPPPRDDMDEFIRRSQERFRSALPSGGAGGGKMLFIVALGLALIWLASGIYKVEPEEEGVVLRFGEYHRTTQPGLQYHWPFPIERVFTPQVTRIQSISIGFREMQSARGDTGNRPIYEEARMLTGDNNVIIVPFSVQWKIKDAKNFLFNIRNPEGTVKDAAESVMREVISNHPLDAALAVDKQVIEQTNKLLLQRLLNDYGAGINIERVQMREVSAPEQVKDAFDDVQAARQDRDTTINRATAYANEILPKARGEAEQLIQQSLAYEAEVTNRAEGDASRFLAIYNEYKQAKDITRKRLYLEMMESIMEDMDKVILDQENGSGVVPYMALPEIEKRRQRNTGEQQ